LNAAGYDLRMHLEPLDDHDRVLEELEASRSERSRAQRDAQQEAWRRARLVESSGTR